MYKNPVKKPELLAPAGSLEAFFAAMEKGADAVYTGLKEFSARAKAKNFSLTQLERMTGYAHGLGRKVYVTLNTLVKEGELPALVEALASLEAIGVDAIIVQDLAVARLARNYFPGLALHASTQMTIHNSVGVKQLALLGFERAVLARELHLDEIRSIADTSPIGIECFIHGALCFSVSGQCYFSSFLGGHSGNRGRCAQPCRRLYRYRGKEGYYCSTNDFSSIDLLPEVVTAGISSLKIEGRMKSAEYVACVVEAYRRCLDASPKEWPTTLAAAKDLLKLSFGRVPTKGFLTSHNPTDIATPTLRGATGRFLGEIKSVKGDRISFEIRDRLHVGDRIRIQPKSDLAGKAFTVKELFVGNRPAKVAQERTLVTVSSPFPVQMNDAVFKVSSETAFTMSENACLKRLEGVKGVSTYPCRLTCAMAGTSFTVTAQVAGRQFSQEYPMEQVEPSRTTDMQGVLTAQFSRTGETEFTLAGLDAPDFPAILIPPALLKDIRRRFYRSMGEWLLPQLKAERHEARQRALASLVPRRPPVKGRGEVIIRIEHLRDYHLLHQDQSVRVSLPVSRANLHQISNVGRKLKGREDRLIWRLPFIIFEKDLDFYREALAVLAGCGFRHFEAANLGHFPLLHDMAENPQTRVGQTGERLPFSFSTDYRLFSLNSQALLAWQELGASAATLYIEDDADNMAALLAANLPMSRQVLIYGGIPVITSKIEIKGVRPDAPLLSDRGDAYTVTTKDGLTVITPERRFSLLGQRNRLQELGCGGFVIDLSQMPNTQWPQVFDAFQKGVDLPGTTNFNFQSGLV